MYVCPIILDYWGFDLFGFPVQAETHSVYQFFSMLNIRTTKSAPNQALPMCHQTDAMTKRMPPNQTN